MEEEVRKAAIMEYLKGTIYTTLQRSKRWFFKWLERYQTGDLEWYKEHSRKPKSHPRQTSREERALIVSTRQKLEDQPFGQVGTSSIKWELHKLGLSFPSDRTINRIPTREGLTKKNCLHPEGCRVSLLHGTGGYQQPASGGSRRSPLYQGRRGVLFAQHHGRVQPPGLYRVPENQGRPQRGSRPHAVLEDHGYPCIPKAR